MTKILPLCGLPRSGTTLVTHLLAQDQTLDVVNPSGLLGIVNAVREAWGGISEHREFDRPDRLLPTLAGTVAGYHRRERVVDFSRHWPSHLDMMLAVTGQDLRVVAMVRDIPSVLASFVSLRRRYPLAWSMVDSDGDNDSLEDEVAGYWGRGPVGRAWSSLRTACGGPEGHRVLLVEYADLVAQPILTLNTMRAWWGLEPFEFIIEEFAAEYRSHDLFAHGLDGLHRVRTSRVSNEASPAEDVLGDLTPRYRGYEFWRRDA